MDLRHQTAMDWGSGGVVKRLGLRPKKLGSNPKIGSFGFAPYPPYFGDAGRNDRCQKGSFYIVGKNKAK